MKLSWDDVQIKTGHLARGNKLRVFCSLKGAAFVNWLAWIENFDEEDGATRAVILLQLHRKLKSAQTKLRKYERIL